MKRMTKFLNRVVFAIVLGAVGGFAMADSSQAIRVDYPITRLTDRVYVIYGPVAEPDKINQGFRNNVVVVTTDNGVVVMDPGTSVYVGNMVLEKIRTITKDKVVAVFNSHEHGDHWLGNEAFKKANPNVKIYAHPKMIELARNGEGEHWLKLFNAATDNAVAGTKPVPPTIAVKDKQEIEIGGVKFRIHSTGPAHSHDDIMIEIPQEKLLFTGDIVRNGMLGINEINFKGYLTAIERILQTQATIYIPGHGKAGDRKIVLAYQNLISTIRSIVAEHYENGMTDYQAKPYVVNALEEYRGWYRFKEHIGRLVSLAYLEVESEAFQ